MKKALYALAVLIPVAALTLVGFAYANGAKAAPATCTPTGFYRDSINLTAARINPSGTLTGTINATGCNIGVYYGPGSSGTVYQAKIYGANYFGVVNNGGHVNVSTSKIYDIGESPLNGDQHGVAIYFAYGSAATGEIAHNTIWNYQKGGIVVNGANASAKVSYNTVTGQGPVNYIAQNGIQIGYGATATVSYNTVTGNSYTGAGLTASGGIIVVGGACYGDVPTVNTQILGNTVTGNDIGIWLSNVDADCYNAVTTPTNINVFENTSRNDAVNNTTGAGPGAGYQAGIADQGDGDQLIKNKICGVGYTPVLTPPPYLFMIDDTVTNNIVESGNTTCSATPPGTEPSAPTRDSGQSGANPMP